MNRFKARLIQEQALPFHWPAPHPTPVIQQNGWEEFSRLTDDQIWDDNDTPSDLTDDTGLAVEIVNQVKARGPFMSISDFVNRRIGIDSRSYQGAIQEAIEQAGHQR